MSIDVEHELKRFLELTCVRDMPAAILNSWQAAARVRKYPIYKTASDKFRDKAKTIDKIHCCGNDFADVLSKSKSAKSTMSDQQLLTKVHKFQEWTKDNSLPLGFSADGVSFGVAQKYLNLLAKFLWALGNAPCPPHCPIDSIVLDKLHKKLREKDRIEDARRVSKFRWTRMTADQYNEVIRVAVDIAKCEKQELAEWELVVWNNSKRKGIPHILPVPSKCL